MIEEFQNYIGKRMQRLHPKSPNTCSYYGLGWMRLERYIQIKKLMFIRTILVMDEDDLPKVIFCQRARLYLVNIDVCQENRDNSAAFDLLNVSCIFGMLDDVRNMVESGHFYPKMLWKDKVWKKGWELEDTYWRIECVMHRSMDHLSNICSSSRYLIWWSVADKYPQYVKKCEIMCKLICHASALRADDFKLKSQLRTFKMCELCNMFELEDARHFLLQCPFFHNERVAMLNEIRQIDNGENLILNEGRTDLLYVLLGKTVTGLDVEVLEKLCFIVLDGVSDIYRKNVKLKGGIG